ncbi:MAG: orotate phosphoribosyltransferase [Cyclobacteriaceae bacterium]|jgi:orotate phosphoribosyltransferase
MSVKNHIASELLKIEAIKLSPKDPFSWSSGWNSPIYCDNRMTLSHPELRTFIKKAFKEEILSRYPLVEAIAGVATAGIAQGALVADILDLPFIYVRAKEKGHGMTNLIEGEVRKDQKVVVIEDLISTGGSSIKAALALREAGLEVLGLGAIFTYGFPHAAANFAEEKLDFFTLSDYTAMLEPAVRMGYVNDNDLQSLAEWRENPEEWGSAS